MNGAENVAVDYEAARSIRTEDYVIGGPWLNPDPAIEVVSDSESVCLSVLI